MLSSPDARPSNPEETNAPPTPESLPPATHTDIDAGLEPPPLEAPKSEKRNIHPGFVVSLLVFLAGMGGKAVLNNLNATEHVIDSGASEIQLSEVQMQAKLAELMVIRGQIQAYEQAYGVSEDTQALRAQLEIAQAEVEASIEHHNKTLEHVERVQSDFEDRTAPIRAKIEEVNRDSYGDEAYDVATGLARSPEVAGVLSKLRDLGGSGDSNQ